jgi:hypothetical protein
MCVATAPVVAEEERSDSREEERDRQTEREEREAQTNFYFVFGLLLANA